MNLFFKNLILAVTIIGALNWGIIGLFDLDIVSYFLGEGSFLSRLIYTLIGACALFSATFAVIDCQCYCKILKNRPNNEADFQNFND